MEINTCEICNEKFSYTKIGTNIRRTCNKHKGWPPNNWRVINDIIFRRCSKCKKWKSYLEDYKIAPPSGRKPNEKRNRISQCWECLKKGNSIARNKQTLKRKIQFIKEKGGCCEICGYNRNICALTFHHIDESTKLFEINRNSLGSKNIKILKEELQKCQLLCFNCHMETHNSEYTNQFLL